MMEDAGDVKFSVGYVETKAKLKVEINEDWRNSMKGGTVFMCITCLHQRNVLTYLLVYGNKTRLINVKYIYYFS